jgi:hypothetical protein
MVLKGLTIIIIKKMKFEQIRKIISYRIIMEHITVPYRHGGGRMKKINAWYLNTHMVYL